MFIELHYVGSGDAFTVNLNAISRVYFHHETGETRIVLLEDKNKSDENPTVCSRQAVYRVKETYEQVRALIRRVAGPIPNVDSLEGGIPNPRQAAKTP